MTGAVQATIFAGEVVPSTKDAGAVKFDFANSVLGGEFTSRLNMNLREKNGFTYGVRSGFGFRKAPGPFMIQTAVATDVTARALDEIWKETKALLQDGATVTVRARIADRDGGFSDYTADVEVRSLLGGLAASPSYFTSWTRV